MIAVPIFDTIYWHLLLDTPNTESAVRIVSRVGKLLGVELEAISLDPYWKDTKLTDARLRSAIPATNDSALATFVLMQNVQRLAHGFSTSGPQTYEGGLVEMDVYATSGFVAPGLAGWKRLPGTSNTKRRKPAAR